MNDTSSTEDSGADPTENGGEERDDSSELQRGLRTRAAVLASKGFSDGDGAVVLRSQRSLT